MATRMVARRITDIWSIERTILGPGSSARNEEDAADMPVSDDGDKFLMETEDVRPTYVEMLRIVE